VTRTRPTIQHEFMYLPQHRALRPSGTAADSVRRCGPTGSSRNPCAAQSKPLPPMSRVRQVVIWFHRAVSGFYAQCMLDLGGIDIEELATALADQTDFEHRWLINPRTGQVVFWTSDTGIDGQNPVEIDELDLTLIEPLPPYVWFQDMVDFAEGISDTRTGRRLGESLRGRGAFRRFKNLLYEHHPDLIRAWHALREVRAQRRAVDWLLKEGLIDDEAVQQFAAENPDPDLP